MASAAGASQPVLSVAQLNRLIATLIESQCPAMWVAGEISNFTRAASGHWYFTLKDASAQVRCVMFRSRAQAVGFQPREGDRVELRALPSLYQPRGDFQLGVDLMRRAGAGDLHQQFLAIKQRLLDEGLLEPERKRPLPTHPRTIGVITSLQAAALRDVLAVLRTRAPHVRVIIHPSPVQGVEAPAALRAAFAVAAQRRECELLLLVRGGGSIEDLWAFNDEQLARAIAASPIPVISGVGHETDFTIADFVADARAPTPTAAATLAVPSRDQLRQTVDRLARELMRAHERAHLAREQRLDIASRQLRSPAAYWAQRGRELQMLAMRLRQAGASGPQQTEQRLRLLASRLRPPSVLGPELRLKSLAARLPAAQAGMLAARSQRTEALAHALTLISPQSVLGRGYAILQHPDGRIVRQVDDTQAGDRLRALLASGSLALRVEATPPAPAEGSH